MKSVLISVQPKWCELIASGKKTIEIRKTKPKLETPFKCYIYMTAGNASYPIKKNGEPYICHNNGGRVVIGEFICDNIFLWNQDIHDNDTITIEEASELACLSEDELLNYADGYFYGWHISNLKLYEHSRVLSEFYKNGTLSNDDYLNTLYDGYKTYGEYMFTRALRKPPQSWCYVEEVK